MGIIHKLSTEISNQIAAGEVVENPASVVKELVENAIDAGASAITVRIEGGGVRRITVSDNGSGMNREDAELCFQRHATSKIQEAKDLDEIYTLGFRGEALSSIAAVAQMELTTKRPQDAMGTRIVFAGGEMLSCEETGAADGTVFVVSNLFYNTPARQRFLKSDSAEGARIAEVMVRCILSHPEVSFRFINGMKEQYCSPGDNDLQKAVYAVYGKSYAKSTIRVAHQEHGIKVTGLIGKSDTARGNRNYQSFFINQRHIKSPLLTKALEDAFKNQIMIGKFPMAILNLEIKANRININVHPTKQEVRFADGMENEVFLAVRHAVENALYTTVNIPKVERKTESGFAPAEKGIQTSIGMSTDEKPLPQEKTEETKKIATPVQPQRRKKLYQEEDKILPETVLQESMEQKKPIAQASPAPKKADEAKLPNSYEADVSAEYFEKRRKEIVQKKEPELGISMRVIREEIQPSAGEETKPEAAKEETISAPPAVKEPPIVQEEEYYRVIGQVFRTYILVERGDELLMIDQHAAHERIKFEELKDELSRHEALSQGLLMPVTIDLSPTEFVLYEENGELLQNLGFEAEAFGRNSVIVRMAPAAVEPEDISDVLIEILENISNQKDSFLTQKAERAAYTIACKAAAKANHKMEQKEMESLVREVFALGTINTCPHGRPIMISMSKKEMEKEFKRIL